MTPAGPDSVDLGALGNIDNEIYIGIVVIIGTTSNLTRQTESIRQLNVENNEMKRINGRAAYGNKVVCHSNVFGIGT